MASTNIYEDPEAWAASLDPASKVGARHHVVPRFVLERWADKGGRVRVRSKVGDRVYDQHVKDLGITDFYTAVSVTGTLDASMEEIISVIEGEAASVIRELMSPFAPLRRLDVNQAGSLANFVAFQMVRGPRRRREIEIQADWYTKTLNEVELRKHLSDEEIRGHEFVPHQNDHIKMLGSIAEPLAARLVRRPVALLTIDRPLFFIGDEPVIVSVEGGHVEHHPDCFMTDEEYAARLKKQRRRKGSRRYPVSRVVHMASTQPRGVDKADEVVMPISPRTLLIWGPEIAAYDGIVERIRYAAPRADEVAALVNDHQVEWSLDTIVTRRDDDRLSELALPEPKPLFTICDGSGPAKDAVNQVPTRIRPYRLDKSAETLAEAAGRGKNV